jgi:EAL domain-containing protein (putative c-di-GMP-specific phosphodiesterase class I)
VRELIAHAHLHGKWVHAGRVNMPQRLDYFRSLGVHSIDGTGLSRCRHKRRNLLNTGMLLNLESSTVLA